MCCVVNTNRFVYSKLKPDNIIKDYDDDIAWGAVAHVTQNRILKHYNVTYCKLN